MRILTERLQFAIAGGAWAGAGGDYGRGAQRVACFGRARSRQAPTRGEAEKGRAPSAESTVIFASLFRESSWVVICCYIRQPFQTSYKDLALYELVIHDSVILDSAMIL